MCQQWFSVAGLVLDIVGVLLIVAEWRIAFRQHFEAGKAEIDSMMKRWVDRMEGRVAEIDIDADSPASGRAAWATLMGATKMRGGLVYVGIAFIVFGFAGQLLGSWPYGVPYFGFKSC
jgi:hypothetical protein